MRGALLALAIGIIVGVAATLQFGLPGRKQGTVGTPAAKPAIARAPAANAPVAEASAPSPAGLVAPATGAVIIAPDFASLAERLSPVVVNISTRAQRTEQADTPRFRGPGQPGPQWPFGEGDPRDFTEPFERFFGPGPRQRQQPRTPSSTSSRSSSCR